MSFKCAIGWHKWNYIPEMDGKWAERTCIVCGKRQIWDAFSQDWSSSLLYLNDGLDTDGDMYE